jgi:hypothetical protein
MMMQHHKSITLKNLLINEEKKIGIQYHPDKVIHEKVILRLNSEYQLEIKDASENFKKNLNSLKLNIEDYVPSDLFN